jgi:hypothetical protein
MITAEEFVARWRDSPLIHIPPRDVQKLNIPEPSKQFLVEAGLPKEPYSPLRCDCLEKGLRPLSSFREGKPASCEADRYYLLGSWGNQLFLCLDTGKNGMMCNVKYVDGSVRGGEFVNSSLPQFAECVLVERELTENFLFDPRFLEKRTVYLRTGESYEADCPTYEHQGRYIILSASGNLDFVRAAWPNFQVRAV